MFVHSNNHYFSIRKIHGRYFNLNSTNTHSPQLIPVEKENELFEKLSNTNFIVFEVVGEIPEPNPHILLNIVDF